MRRQSALQVEDPAASTGFWGHARALGRILLDQTVSRSQLSKPRRSAQHLGDLIAHGLVVPPAGITCLGTTDGPGAQLHARLSAICFCRIFGVPYIHSTLQIAEHISTKSELLAWEHFFNLSHFSETTAKYEDEFVPIQTFLTDVSRWRKATFLSVKNMHGFIDRFPHIYCSLRYQFRIVSQLGPNVERRPYTIAVHVRRGDVSQSQNHDRFTPTQFVVNALQDLLAGFEEIGVATCIVIHSQGREEDFHDIATAIPCELSLNAGALDTISALANADALILGKSSFSYLAGLLCPGIVVYEPFWHSPLPDWIGLALDGRILGPEKRKLMAALNRLETRKNRRAHGV